MSSEMMTFQDCRALAVSIANSGFMGVKNADEALTLMMLAQAEGRHPAIVARDYHVISGKPTLKADAILSRFQEAGGSVNYLSYTDEKCVIEFKHPQGGNVTIDWDIQRANRAGVTGNQTWKKYPRAMLRARCISEGVRTIYPAVLCGVYTPEEVQDMDYSSVKQPQQQTVIEIEAPKKPVLSIGTPQFESAINAIRNGKTIDDLCGYYEVTEDVLQAVKSAIMVIETMEPKDEIQD